MERTRDAASLSLYQSAAKSPEEGHCGAGLLWFYNLLFGFTMPVVLPSLMEQYDIMAYYAIMGGITSLVGCIVTPIGGKLGDRFGRRRVCLLAGYLRLALMLFAPFLPTVQSFLSYTCWATWLVDFSMHSPLLFSAM